MSRPRIFSENNVLMIEDAAHGYRRPISYIDAAHLAADYHEWKSLQLRTDFIREKWPPEAFITPALMDSYGEGWMG